MHTNSKWFIFECPAPLQWRNSNVSENYKHELKKRAILRSNGWGQNFVEDEKKILKKHEGKKIRLPVRTTDGGRISRNQGRSNL